MQHKLLTSYNQSDEQIAWLSRDIIFYAITSLVGVYSLFVNFSINILFLDGIIAISLVTLGLFCFD